MFSSVSVCIVLLSMLPMVVMSQAFNIWPGIAPNETTPIGPEARTNRSQLACGQTRDQLCYYIYNVSTPTLTPYLVTNGTGAAVIIAPGVPAYIYIIIYMYSFFNL